MSEPVIVAKELVKYYKERGFFAGRKLALNRFNLEVSKGERVAVLGPNGAGKTTFLRIIFGLIYPSGGEVRVFGKTAEDISWRAWAGYVPEFYSPARFLTAQEILEISARTNGMNKKDFDQALDWLEKKLGIKELLELRVRQFSRGMVQQLALASALIHNPELVVLDEPTANLDALSRRRLKELLKELSGQGKTILLSSHILSEVEELCDKVVIIKNGQVIKRGSTEELLGREEGYLICFKTPSQLPEQLEKFGAISMDAERKITSLSVSDEYKKDLAVKALSENNIPIELLEPKQKTLEEYFLELTQQEALEKYFLEIVKEQ